MTSTPKITLSEAEAAKYLGVSRSNLRQGRMNGLRPNRCPPPPFVRLGRKIVYLKADLDGYLEERRVVTRDPKTKREE